MTAWHAAAIIYALALGQTDDRFEPVERDDPRAALDAYAPPADFPVIRPSHRDGDDRPETIAAVAGQCDHVCALRTASAPAGGAA